MPIYLFLDEAGNFDFSPNGTRWFVLTCTRLDRPFAPLPDLLDLKYELIESRRASLSYFHASEDRQPIRDAVMSIAVRHSPDINIDAFVIEKRLVVEAMRTPESLYVWGLRKLLEPIIRAESEADRPLIIFTDKIPVNRRREIVEKAIKKALSSSATVPFQILHHESRTNLNLQLADYMTWSVFRKWERGDHRSYDLIRQSIRSERIAFASSQ